MNDYYTRDELHDLPNVRGTAFGTDDTLLVFVTKKVPRAELADGDAVPQSLVLADSPNRLFSTRVIEANIPHTLGGFSTTHGAAIQASESHRERHRPAPGGVSIGPDQRSAGTMGYSLFEDRDGEPVCLTNQHVAASPRRASDRIFQPAILDGGGDGDVIGTLKEATESSTEEMNYSDSALVRVDPDDVSGEIQGLGTLSDTDGASFAFSYQKSGRTTGVTDGDLLGVDGRFNITSGEDTLPFDGLDVFDDMSASGDSGSLIGYMTPGGFVATSLLFAGSDTITLGIPFAAVEDAHGPLSVWDEPDPEPEPEPEPDPDNGGDESPAPSWGQFRHDATVDRVVDGDTVVTTAHHGPLNLRSSYTIRLLEIDTAERGHPDFQEHTQFVEEWVQKGIEEYDPADDAADPQSEYPFLLDTHQDQLDAFGRLLTYVVRKCDGADLTTDLLAVYGEEVRYDINEQLERLLD